MRGNSHVRFLGGKRAAMPLTYPIDRPTWHSVTVEGCVPATRLPNCMPTIRLMSSSMRWKSRLTLTSSTSCTASRLLYRSWKAEPWEREPLPVQQRTSRQVRPDLELAPPQEQDTAEKHETNNIETEQSIVGKQARSVCRLWHLIIYRGILMFLS